MTVHRWSHLFTCLTPDSNKHVLVVFSSHLVMNPTYRALVVDAALDQTMVQLFSAVSDHWL